MNWLRKIMGGSGSQSRQAISGEDPPLKTVTYRGGIVTFRIPAPWVEEYEPEGGGTFYDHAPDSATLRLEVITTKAPSPLGVDGAPEVLSSLRQRTDAAVEQLPNRHALVRYTQSAVDRGHALLITYWSVAQVIPPHHARIATFSYTLLETQRDSERFRREIALLDREIRSSVFSPEVGVTSA
jgi:hypothetical protein